MSSRSKTICVLFICFILSFPEIKAQIAQKDSLVPDPAAAIALRQYHAYIKPETDLYRGPEYVDYAYQIKEGHPYFEDSIIEGSIVYNKVLYQHVALIYDMVLDLVVIKDPYEVWKIGLNRQHVDSFTIETHRFIRIGDSLNPTAPRNGFYEQLYRGRLRLLKKQVKSIQQQASFLNNGFEQYTLTSVFYYLKAGDNYYPVNNQRSLLSALKDKNREVKKFIRSNHLSMRKDKENTLVKVITWYDGLTQ